MRTWGVWVVAVMTILGCTRPNPRSCADGTCTDPAFPFCDVDGAFSGQPMSCIEVTCTPGQVDACREDGAITCNGDGSSYDVVACASGCDVGTGCRACTVNEDCGSDAPICDPGLRSCRACEHDDECASSVCKRGRCFAESEIAYAAPSGSGDSDCSQAAPCTAMRVIATATNSTPQLTVRLLPGLYTGGVEVRTATPTPLEIVGTGATLDALEAGLRVLAGSNVTIRGISASGDNRAISCGAGQTALTTLTVENSVVSANNDLTTLVVTTNCRLTMSAVELRGSTGVTTALALSSDSVFDGDRLHVHSMTTSGIQMLGSRIQARVTNSLLENVQVLFSTFDSQPPGSQASFGFNTFVLGTNDSAIACISNSGSAHRVVRFENNIIFAPALSKAVEGDDCFLSNNLLMPQPSAPLYNLVADPEFVDASTGDFRLRPTSSAIGAGQISVNIFTDHDFVGAPRPQGGAADIGAYEQ